MNIEQANAIPLSEILEKIGCQPTKQKGHDIWYNSPLRSEKTASFHINTAKNVWYDFGEAKGGDAVDFVCAYLQSNNEDDTVVDSLRWLRNMMFTPSKVLLKSEKEPAPPSSTLMLHRISELKHPGLAQFLKSRGIPMTLAKKYLKEIVVRNDVTKKNFFAVGLRNEGNGFELRNAFFKGCISSKSISFIRGSKPVADEVHIFEGALDFLSALIEEKEETFEGDIIILNSVSALSQAFPYIKNYPYKKLYSWLDNDDAGRKATEVLKTFIVQETKISFKSMNYSYAEYKDVNALLMYKLGL